MKYYEEDIEKTIRIIKGLDRNIDDIAGLYRNTNEDLNTIFKDIDFKDKKVLSVLSSSDQLFSSFILGAKEVDTFDANRLTEYYFYLRKWCLEETKKYYIPADDKLLTNIVEKHYDENKKVAKLWIEVIKEATPSLYYSSLFYRPPLFISLPYLGKEIELIKLLNEKDHTFIHMNIFEKQVNKKKYDIIILSNIIEYLLEYDNKTQDYYFANNILELLEDDGIVLTSKVFNEDNEESILDKYFDKKPGKKGMIPCGGEIAPLSYQYTKKSLTVARF